MSEQKQAMPPERIWIDRKGIPESPKYAGTFYLDDDPDHETVSYILATPSILAADPAVKVLVAEAEARVMRIAAGLFPGGYDANFAKIEAAIRGEKP